MTVINMDEERHKRDLRPRTNHRAWSPVAGVVRWELKMRHLCKIIAGSMDPATARRIGQMYLDAARDAERQNGGTK